MPLISYLLPTGDRRRFVHQAIHCFVAEHYAEKELVIIGGGAKSAADLMPDARNMEDKKTYRLGLVNPANSYDYVNIIDVPLTHRRLPEI